MRTHERQRNRTRHVELIWDAAIALAFAFAALGLFAALWSPPASSGRPQQVFIGTLDATAAKTDTISVRVTARGSLQNIISGPEIEVQLPRDATVAQLSGRLTDRYPVLEPFAMVSLNGGMLPQSLVLQDGQTVELMEPHSAGLTFLGKPLPTPQP